MPLSRTSGGENGSDISGAVQSLMLHAVFLPLSFSSKPKLKKKRLWLSSTSLYREVTREIGSCFPMSHRDVATQQAKLVTRKRKNLMAKTEKLESKLPGGWVSSSVDLRSPFRFTYSRLSGLQFFVLSTVIIPLTSAPDASPPSVFCVDLGSF